ncbi:MAG: hypothetical protein HYX28_07140 [Candidatus Koribacter versatilis]|uniref:Uncharacterized protein n=1 Tax=Candidatus Korobacter versatilis TaxID=658062 RepID=A0A932EP83_9BACT|nr:hypothetical protein [Candidatus Koribacter versatilis]
MKAIASISTMVLAAGMAAGQAYPAMASGQQAYPPAKAAAPASQSTATKTAAAKPATKPATKPAAKPASQPATAKAAPATKPAPTKTELSKGKRDPFISPVVVRMGAAAGTSCTTGKRCLIIDQLTVQGVVCNRIDTDTQPHSCKGWIAVIGNPAKKVYYLRENDALFDGFVKRIAGDSVVFQQNIVDALGKQATREVVKRISPSA